MQRRFLIRSMGGAKALIECWTCLKMDAVSFLTIARFKGSEKQLGL